MSDKATRPAHHRMASYLHGHRRLRLLLLLAVPVIWLVVIYGGSLASLLVQSFYRLNPFSGTLERVFSFDTWGTLFTDANVAVMVRTVGMATAVTIASVILAFPLAYYMAKFATVRTKAVLVLLVPHPVVQRGQRPPGFLTRRPEPGVHSLQSLRHHLPVTRFGRGRFGGSALRFFHRLESSSGEVFDEAVRAFGLPAQALQDGQPGDGHEPALADLVREPRQFADALQVVAGR